MLIEEITNIYRLLEKNIYIFLVLKLIYRGKQ